MLKTHCVLRGSKHSIESKFVKILVRKYNVFISKAANCCLIHIGRESASTFIRCPC